jgi:ATPase subunit of ABC transporter with duplicated ATPase domains
MGHVEVAHVSHTLPNGRVLLDDVSFRVGDGVTAALVGPNGAGKTTLLRLIAGDLTAQQGTVSHSGGLGVMRQFIGGIRDSTTVDELLLSVAPPRIREAAAAVEAAELVLMERDDEPAQIRYANALATWGERRGRPRRRNTLGRLLCGRVGRPVRLMPVAPGHHPFRR